MRRGVSGLLPASTLFLGGCNGESRETALKEDEAGNDLIDPTENPDIEFEFRDDPNVVHISYKMPLKEQAARAQGISLIRGPIHAALRRVASSKTSSGVIPNCSTNAWSSSWRLKPGYISRTAASVPGSIRTPSLCISRRLRTELSTKPFLLGFSIDSFRSATCSRQSSRSRGDTNRRRKKPGLGLSLGRAVSIESGWSLLD